MEERTLTIKWTDEGDGVRTNFRNDGGFAIYEIVGLLQMEIHRIMRKAHAEWDKQKTNALNEKEGDR